MTDQYASPIAGTSTTSTPPTVKKVLQPSKINQFFTVTPGKRYQPDYATHNDELEMDSRTVNEPSLGDILMAINGVKSEVRTSTALQMEKIEELRSDMNSQLTEMHSQISDVSKRISTVETSSASQSADVSMLKNRLMTLEQEKLSTHMSISGIRRQVLEPRKREAASYARELIRGMGIPIQDGAIIDAYVFELPRTKTLKLTVIFDNFHTKVNVMRAKRAITGDTGIYFENAMIPEVRQLFARARNIARSAVGLKSAILKSNKVYIVKSDDSLLIVSTEADAQRIESEFPEKKPVNSSSNSTQATRQSNTLTQA